MSTDSPGVYLLGSLNRHITVHSQQRRAINLILALQESGGLDGKSIAIVGAGFAGLTAAAFALEKTTAKVTLFDAAPRPLWLQDHCSNRWLHPGIYDWPAAGSLEPCTALPVLNWRAGAARDVAAQIHVQWERIAATKGLLRLRLETRITRVTHAVDGRLLLHMDQGKKSAFDVIVLAVGFGLEPGKRGRAAYWNDADGLDGIARGASVLVSGFGDGGLADVLRLCLPDIRQDNLIELVRHVPAKIQRELVDADKQFAAHGENLEDFYAKLQVEPVIQHILDSAPPMAQVTLAGKGHLYGPRSAILNRFLISQLRQARGNEAFTLVNKAVDNDSVTDLPDGRWGIKFHGSGEQHPFQHVVLRLGPESAYSRIAPLSDWKIGEERRRHWYEMPQSMDRTRVPLREGREVEIPLDDRQDFLAYESSSRRWCLVLQPRTATINWAVHVRHALENAGADFGDLNVEPLVLYSEDAFADQIAIRGVVRALCAADIVIADVTGYDSSLLLLLGIRAAVRRSVTISCTKEAPSPELWENLPFNLKDLNLVSLHDEVTGHEELTATLSAGLSQSGVSSHYLDLPVYDFVRAERADGPALDPQHVLLLRAFKGNEGARTIHVQKRIHQGLRLSEDVKVESVIDQTSPRLAGQRLYEAIRHWTTCVADLTWWRPNVLFELGVRLAVRPSGTYCIVDPAPEDKATFEGSRARLMKFLEPLAYDISTARFNIAGHEYVHNPIYETAARHFRTVQDHFGEQVDAMLLAAAAVTPGHDDPLQAVDITPLYARDNRDYGEEIRHSVFERSCAAWYYLADRDEPHAVRPVDLLDRRRLEAFRRFRRLGSRLKAGLAQRRGPRDDRLRKRILSAERRANESGATALAELLDAWLALRSDPPWQFDMAKFTKEDVEDCDNQRDQLNALENRLTAIDSPVCELPLQGVRSDRRRLEIVMQQFSQRVP